MQGKGPAIPVRLNRRVLLRPMAMMAGDHLADIRKATRDNRAEFRNSIKVYNGSVAAVMNRELGIQYRELAFKVSTFRRKQHTIYKTMCQLVALKRKMLKDAIAKEDHGAQEIDIVARHVAVNNAVRGGAGTGARPLPPLESITSALAEITKANRPSPPPAPQEFASRAHLLAPLPPTLASPSDLQAPSGDGTASVGTDAVAAAHRRGVRCWPKESADPAQPKAATRGALAAAPMSITERALKLLADGSVAGASGRVSREPAAHSVSAKSPASLGPVWVSEPPTAIVQTVTAANAKRAFFTATISRFPALPPIGEAPGCASTDDEWDNAATPTNAARPSAPAPLVPPTVSKCWRLAARPSLHTDAADPVDVTGAAGGQWSVSERTKSLDAQRRATNDDHSAAAESQSAESAGGGHGRWREAGALPLAIEVRRSRKRKDAKRKEILDSEICPIYRQMASGYFRSEETPYRREEFHVPTGSAEYRRRKLLETVKSTIDEHAAKASAFLASISLQEEKENKIAIVKTPDTLPPVTKFKSAPPAADNTRDLENCTYVRRYIRPAERDGNLPVVTSWHQKE